MSFATIPPARVSDRSFVWVPNRGWMHSPTSYAGDGCRVYGTHHPYYKPGRGRIALTHWRSSAPEPEPASPVAAWGKHAYLHAVIHGHPSGM